MSVGVPMLTDKISGGLMFQFPRPDGLPEVDTPRVKMVRLLRDVPALNRLLEKERDAVSISLATTLCRALYHWARFNQVITTLNQRREQSGGYFGYDLFAQYAFFEAGATLGAIRLGVDEIIYIVARLQDVSPQVIHKAWKAETVTATGFDKRPDLDLPEVRALRARIGWYEEMNDYRNALYHRGWRDPFVGYVPLGSDLPEALLSEHNVMLVPDRASLVGKTRSHDWRYTEGVRLEDVLRRSLEGFENLLDSVCIGIWGAVVSAEAALPREIQPNLIVRLVNPALLSFSHHALLPVFTSRDAAYKFDGFPSYDGLHLTEVLPNTWLTQEPAFTLGMLGLSAIPRSAADNGSLVVVIDPSDFDVDVGSQGKERSLNITAVNTARESLAKLFEAGDTEPLSISQTALGVDHVYVWRLLPETS